MRFAMGALGGAWLGTEAGTRYRPSSSMQATLFAVLLLNRGRTVSLDVLVDALWPGGTADPVANRNSLRVHMSNLRRWVRDIAGDDAASRFETRGDGYALSLEPAEFDVVAFENAVALGQSALLDERNDAAHDSLRTALAMWAHPYPELAQHQPAGFAPRKYSQSNDCDRSGCRRGGHHCRHLLRYPRVTAPIRLSPSMLRRPQPPMLSKPQRASSRLRR